MKLRSLIVALALLLNVPTSAFCAEATGAPISDQLQDAEKKGRFLALKTTSGSEYFIRIDSIHSVSFTSRENQIASRETSISYLVTILAGPAIQVQSQAQIQSAAGAAQPTAKLTDNPGTFTFHAIQAIIKKVQSALGDAAE